MKENRLRRFKIDKLVRDKMPENLSADGIRVFIHEMDQEEYETRLKDKVIEEAQEVLEARTDEEMLNELTDLLEVVYAIGKILGVSQGKIEARRLLRLKERGGFEKRLYCSGVEMESTNKNIGYYRSRPEDYPEVS